MVNEALFVVDKEEGPSSFDIVRKVKRLFPREKVGHAGSLDPFATGVLVVLLGRATKLSNALLNADKTYRATLKLGTATDSMDKTGKVTVTKEVPPLTNEAVEAVFAKFVGEWWQTPPMFSAKKVQGVRLYELARKNIDIPREKIPVQLYRLELIELTAEEIIFEVHCSKGTYIRSLADELAITLGTVGHLSALRRLSCGSFKIEESLTTDALALDPATARAKGYENFIRLLRAENVVRARQAAKPGGIDGFGAASGAPLAGENPQLPRMFNGDKPMPKSLVIKQANEVRFESH